MAKVTVSFEWLSGCSGCELSIVDLHERLLAVLEEIDIVRLPILMDVKDYPKAALGIITGALRTHHDVECAKKMRASCTPSWPSAPAACTAGRRARATPTRKASWPRRRSYQEPDHLHAFRTLTRACPSCSKKACCRSMRPFPVDLYLPGCPPHAFYVFEALKSMLHGKPPSSASTTCASTAIAT
jgi:F420-non-reducing hydrogenase small subunit